MLKRLDHIGIIVKDLQKAQKGYAGALALKAGGAEELPTVQHLLRSDARVIGPEAALAGRLESGYLLNTALLGRLSAALEIAEEHWLAALRAGIKPEYLDENLEAFALGRGYAVG